MQLLESCDRVSLLLALRATADIYRRRRRGTSEARAELNIVMEAVVADDITRALFEDIPESEDDHIDWIETRIEPIGRRRKTES